MSIQVGNRFKHIVRSKFLENIHKICLFSIKDNSLIWFQYKVIYRLIGVKHYLHKINLSTPPTCGLCHENEETIYHLFVSCKESSRFWDDIKVWIKQVLKVEIVLSPSTVIFGNWELETPNYLVNILSIFLQLNIIFSNVHESIIS